MSIDPRAITAQLELASPKAHAGCELRYDVLNTGTKPLMMGMDYALEFLERSTWRDVELPPFAPLVAYGCSPGNRCELTARIPGDCSPGRYRLRQRVEVVTDPGSWNDWGRLKFAPLELIAEFDLVPT